MARTVEQVQAQIESYLQAQFTALSIPIDTTKWSKRNIFRLLCYVFAVCTAYLEQLMDSFKADIEAQISKVSAPSALWIQNQMFLFQYSATSPQILQISDGVPSYPTVDATLRIITACSVASTVPNVVSIKVAKSNPFTALTTEEKAAAQNYINQKGGVGVIYNVISLAPDQMYINADIYYKGQYSAVIRANVIAAINSYFTILSQNNFNGVVRISDIENAIKTTEGVNDVVIKNVRARDNATEFAQGINLVVDTTIIYRSWNTVAGYVISETTTNYTLNDSLNFIAE